MKQARHAVIAFAAIFLLACAMASAAPVAKTAAVHPATQITATQQAHDAAFIKTLRSTTPGTLPVQTNQTAYCSRAIDIDGIFCAIGCPNECSCSEFGIFSQCCC